jgi:putative transposase
MLVKNYHNIIIGNVSTKKMVSNDKSNLPNIVKRRLMTLSHFRFRMKLEAMSYKYGTTLYYTDEYMTSKMCCNCGNIKQNLGSNKTYNCESCRLKVDRDINAAINIYNI